MATGLELRFPGFPSTLERATPGWEPGPESGTSPQPCGGDWWDLGGGTCLGWFGGKQGELRRGGTFGHESKKGGNKNIVWRQLHLLSSSETRHSGDGVTLSCLRGHKRGDQLPADW